MFAHMEPFYVDQDFLKKQKNYGFAITCTYLLVKINKKMHAFCFFHQISKAFITGESLFSFNVFSRLSLLTMTYSTVPAFFGLKTKYKRNIHAHWALLSQIDLRSCFMLKSNILNWNVRIGVRWQIGRAGNSLIWFPSESLVFC